LGLAAALIGALHLAAWLLHIPLEPLEPFEPITIKTNAALCLVLLGTALAIGVPPAAGRLRRSLVTLLPLLAVFIGLLTFLENAFGWDWHIDQLIASEAPGALGVVSPNRMGTPATVGVVLVGLSLVSLARRRPPVVTAQLLGLLAAIVGLLSMMGYLYDVHRLFAVARLTAIALPMALSLFGLGVGVILVHPGQGILAWMTADDPGGHLVRRLLLPTLVVPVVVGWARLNGERLGWFDANVGTSLVSFFFMAVFTVLLFFGARQVNRFSAFLFANLLERERLHTTIAADQDSLRASDERLRTMFDSAAAGIARVELVDGRILRANPQCALLTGYPQDVLETMRLVDLTHVADRPLVEEGLARIRNGEVSGAYFSERRYVRADGAEIDVELHGSVVRDHGRPVEAIMVIVDATARKQADRDLASAKAAAEEASRAKDHLMSVLSHELRTPLSPVLTGLSMLRQEPMSDQALHVVEVAYRNAQLEARLIDDLLDLTRTTRGKLTLDRRRTELGTIIERAVEVCQADIRSRSVHFAVDYGPGPYTVEADAARLQQVFWNVIKNAVKFTPEGGCVGVTCRAVGDRVAIEVTDSGIGIEPSALNGIFDAFVQAEGSTARQFGGLGLGLAISRALVELHGGTIEARSAGAGTGASFVICLPLLACGPEAVEQSALPLSGTERTGRALHVLLVEDHEDTATMLAELLGMAGHSIQTAGTAEAALELSAQASFDVLVSDLGLPDRSGIELMRELRARGWRVPGIALTGYGRETDIRLSQEAGFEAHVVKPADPDHLLEMMQRVAAGHPAG
jgi:PAS domain S-box-containing protein